MNTPETLRLLLIGFATFMLGNAIRALYDFSRHQPGPEEKRHTRKDVHKDLVLMMMGLTSIGIGVIAVQAEKIHQSLNPLSVLLFVGIGLCGLSSYRIRRHMYSDAR